MHRFASYKGDGMYPYTGLTADALGNAYVPPLPAGVMANGTIFKLSPSAGVVGRETCCYGASQLRRGMRPVLQHWCSTELGTDGTYPRFCVQHIPEEPVNVASVPIFFTQHIFPTMDGDAHSSQRTA